MTSCVITSPIGMIRITASLNGLHSLEIVNTKEEQTIQHDEGMNDYITQLNEYFTGTRTVFTIPLDAMGTDFQHDVWNAATGIPFGETRTYQDIAEMVGRPLAVRAVGTTLGKNPLCIVVPCHRVLPKGGEIGEYAYGSSVKRWLLEHEHAIIPASARSPSAVSS